MTIDVNSILQKWKTSLEMVTMWVNTKHYKDFPPKVFKTQNHNILLWGISYTHTCTYTATLQKMAGQLELMPGSHVYCVL